MTTPIEIFFSYAHEDEPLMNDVRKHLIVHERYGTILKWHDRMIPPGDDWKGRIDDRLQVARVILLFISKHFFASDYCHDVEMAEALRRRQDGSATVIPIILRPCDWQIPPLAGLQVLPKDARPLASWRDRDEGCLNVARGVMRVVDELRNADSRTNEGYEQSWQADSPASSARPREALPEFTVIRLLPDQRFPLDDDKQQPWREVDVLKFKRNFVKLPNSDEPNFVLTDPAFEC
jgi:hypothetical protein